MPPLPSITSSTLGLWLVASSGDGGGDGASGTPRGSCKPAAGGAGGPNKFSVAARTPVGGGVFSAPFVGTGSVIEAPRYFCLNHDNKYLYLCLYFIVKISQT